MSHKKYQETARDREVVEMYFDTLRLQSVGDKYGLCRERVRQIMERLGYNPSEIKQAFIDKQEYERIEREYLTCPCGNYFKPNRKRPSAGEILADRCPECYIKLREKYVYKYARQKKWNRENRDKIRVSSLRAVLKYQKKNRRLTLERQKRRYVLGLLNKNDIY